MRDSLKESLRRFPAVLRIKIIFGFGRVREHIRIAGIRIREHFARKTRPVYAQPGFRLPPALFSACILFLLLMIMSFYAVHAFQRTPFRYPQSRDKRISAYGEEECRRIRERALKKPGFTLYTVRNRDNFWQIAQEHGVDIDTILGCNPYLKSIYAYLGQELVVSGRKGVVHYVRKGESLRAVARLYRIPLSRIRKANKIPWWRPGGARKGDVLFIPDVRPVVMTEEMADFFHKREMFLSPIPGVYTSGFGWRKHPIRHVRRFHKGLDISARAGTPVCASAEGTVLFAGWMGGYGKYIRIKHRDNYITGYGHLSRYFVKPGQKVHSGQIIGKTGNSGESTGPHLDFTVFKDNRPVDPALYLW